MLMNELAKIDEHQIKDYEQAVYLYPTWHIELVENCIIWQQLK